MPALAAARWYSGRNGVIDEPGEDIADRALTGFVAVKPGDDAAHHHAAHAIDLAQLRRGQDVAAGGAHHHDHNAGFGRLDRRRGDMRVHIGDGDRDSRRQARQRGHLWRELAGFPAQLSEFAAYLFVDDMLKGRVQRAEVFAPREVAVLHHRLVSGGTGIARLDAGQLPDDPISRLDKAVDLGVDIGALLQDLQQLAEEPLRRDLAAVARQPRLAHLPRRLVDLVGLALRRVMLPELDISVRLVAQFIEEA